MCVWVAWLISFRSNLRMQGVKLKFETVLGHVQRGGTPSAFGRVLASAFGVKAFELVLEKNFGRMVSLKNNMITSVTLDEATKEPNFVRRDTYLVLAAKGLGISFGD